MNTCVYRNYKRNDVEKQEYEIIKVKLLVDWFSHKKGDIVEVCKIYITHTKKDPTQPPIVTNFYLYNENNEGVQFLNTKDRTGIECIHVPDDREEKGKGKLKYIEEV